MGEQVTVTVTIENIENNKLFTLNIFTGTTFGEIKEKMSEILEEDLEMYDPTCRWEVDNDSTLEEEAPVINNKAYYHIGVSYEARHKKSNENK